MNITTVLLDLDGVVRCWDHSIDLEIERKYGLESGAISKIAFSQELLTPAITGQVSDARWRHQIAKALEAFVSERDAKSAVASWSAPIGDVNDHVLDLIRRVRAHANVALVTNATDRLDADLRKLGLLDEIDGYVNSSEVGAIKPSPQIYRAALEQFKSRPQQTAYIDDTHSYVDAAINMGMIGHKYVNPHDMQKFLDAHGLFG
jgi:putative hydrolase of the HAD superfamily